MDNMPGIHQAFVQATVDGFTMGRQALAVVMFACIGGVATASYFGFVPVSDASAWLAEADFVSWSRNVWDSVSRSLSMGMASFVKTWTLYLAAVAFTCACLAMSFGAKKPSHTEKRTTRRASRLIRSIIYDVSQPVSTAQVAMSSFGVQRNLTSDELASTFSSSSAEFRFGRTSIEVMGPVTVEDVLSTVHDLVHTHIQTRFKGIDLDKSGQWTVVVE